MKNSRPVYSTDKGRLCPACLNATSACTCKTEAAALPVGDGNVKVRRETKGRKGKGVSLIEGLALTPAELDALAKQLKTRCGSGGAVKNGIIEIQGDHRPVIIEFLKNKGINAKQAGG
ncbi:translation initiation factor Sui1 [Pseudohongiella acticola]|mgnify:CR=1 FL=1|jgi:translation initiation factor 1|uniref:translation initiation factor Sui1 n=1 Tax=Pseudohongiella acticola TaxID=1524254 RepID=UPI0030EDFBAE|tara:strand:+ start:55 stop:408 length:354 start_codon:yes stop_codon:yes gene_type:complete